MNNVVFSHKSDDWKTPSNIYNWFMNNGFIDCFRFRSDYDELSNDYFYQKLFINPPFSKMKVVCQWVNRQIYNGNFIVMLIPSRTDTSYFHSLLRNRPFIFLIEGRLRYNDSNVAPFPSCFLVINPVRSLGFYSYGNFDDFIYNLNSCY